MGYLEEEAVRTYTHALADITAGKVWKGVAAPPIARVYWRLPEGEQGGGGGGADVLRCVA